MDFVPPLSVGQNPLALLLCSPVFNVYNGQYKYEAGWIEYQATKARLNNKKMLIVRYNYQLSSFISC